MDLHPTDEQQQLTGTLRRLLDRRLAALVEGLPEPSSPDRVQVLNDARQVWLLGLGAPEEAGGAGSFADLAAAHVELGRGLAAPFLTTLTLAIRLALHAETGGPLLPALVEGELLAAPAVDDVDGTVAVLEEGGSPRLTGRKRRVVEGRHVDVLLVVAVSASGGTPLLVRVPVDAAGLDWVEEQGSTDAEHWSVAFEQASIGPAEVLGAVDLGRFRVEAAILAAARQVGGGRAVADRSVEHVRTRVQFDRPIGSFQAVQHQLADVATDLDAAELAVAQAAWSIDAGLAGDAVERYAGVAAVSAAETFRRATLVAHQLHGGMGFVLDSPLHLWSARAVADPTVPVPRRLLLDRLADTSGLAVDGTVTVPPDHRRP